MEKYIENIHESWRLLFIKHNILLNNIFKLIDESELLPVHVPVYPPKNLIFRVFQMDVKEIKLVFLGQDSYHGYGQANGLAFSVEKDIKIPPSLKNIYKELNDTYPEKNYIFKHGDVSRWFYEENIFLLNCGLCVYENKPGSFLNKWTLFTDEVIQYIYENNETCIFLLLGNYAKEKGKFIENKDRIIEGVHPSPLSANRGFIGSKIFKLIDQKLDKDIDWNI
jgi:uracil-DNA glycosylase